MIKMNIFAAANTKNVFHKGKGGNLYQLDTISNQINLESKMTEFGWNINYISSEGKEKESCEMVNLVHRNNYLDIFRQEKSQTTYLSNGLMLQPSLYPTALEHALIAKRMVDSALKNGSAFSTVGGGHHCEFGMPFGFGLVNTLAISAVYATTLKQRVVILDLDTHYSNGCNDLLHNREDILMTSLWNQSIPAWKYCDSKDNLFHVKVTSSNDYFVELKKLMDKIEDFKPSLFIYHLGFDVLDSDRMGGVHGMNKAKLLLREKLVRKFIDKLQTPYLVYRGGGYVDYRDGELETSARKAGLLEIQMSAIKVYI
ncbi:MAG: hypothetical protein UX08_C0019G0017 [Candidatus Collierbacteria bacterium GW2011_GWB1_45_35]|uniref:Histone deacetylase domain-containing protein n=2 Tax=Candidatus Collieribacteriota TaxID=1752725 RepID=A0A0G1NMS5_9BACT|nr:MAG: hypothetical protein UW48_C0015G0016 [Microgenomates group bacterium GW2011_GWC1_44_23]KKT85514.1 MAG: hypothetical protein UW84_C0029G0020 [Candidatus Collierbacteria bacterium GW2011_GWA2_44_99]KKT95149.1 MAG: hypothetical protein UW96_C0010G0017 [Candidatus Collierbacteria bacterium GW2011_GWA1_45_15]KKU00549.1 MAG: hypothetical protein UX01_C0004G0116 [Candidatus Collierbacteria bacterium GW2011_GWB2_45_17]KKU04688.1 MAG: hypothetical protein UX08_C0019G0017 [Candidatus Collierbacte